MVGLVLGLGVLVLWWLFKCLGFVWLIWLVWVFTVGCDCVGVVKCCGLLVCCLGCVLYCAFARLLMVLQLFGVLVVCLFGVGLVVAVWVGFYVCWLG